VTGGPSPVPRDKAGWDGAGWDRAGRDGAGWDKRPALRYLHEMPLPLRPFSLRSFPQLGLLSCAALLPALLLSSGCEGSSKSTPVDDETGGESVDTAGDAEHVVQVPPYLQAVSQTEAWVLWETVTGEHSAVEYGLTEALGVTATGTVQVSELAVLHEVHLPNLLPDTDYYYQARTAGTRSEVAWFHTLPEPGTPFRVVAMSDMQQDDSRPEQWAEVVSQGVAPLLDDGGDPLLMVLLTGDLVDNGWIWTEWTDTFFPGLLPVSAQVPIYPVLGNHEGNSPLFFRYFHMPENAPAGFEDHTWWVDAGNVRVVGLDSNSGQRTQPQLDWLGEVLDDACQDSDIEFVIAQLHHPWKSELWPSGNEDYTGDVITQLNEFTTLCGKPSVHLFGHTHGYSRGQSRDHRHLMVNVASAGGALDRWGSSDQIDYEEFSVSDDAYGTVVLAVEPGVLTVTRMSLGTPEAPLDNVVLDQVTLRTDTTPPATPTPLSAETGDADTSVLLQASPFSGAGQHGASHWQVSADCEGMSAPVVDRWLQYENWFQGEDTQAGDDLSDAEVTLGEGDWCWRVRYRDRELVWSAWSEPTPLTVAVPATLASDDGLP
jgi:acid phosphatase type 7